MTEAFERWFPLCDLALSQLPEYGKFAAGYALRDAITGEILKYGCTGNLRARIFGNYLGGVGGTTTQRIHAELFITGMICRLEIAWIKAKDQAEAKSKESQLRREYKLQRGKRPPWDLMD